MDAMIRVVGAISLWTVEIIMQLRIYALYGCSKRVSVFICATPLVARTIRHSARTLTPIRYFIVQVAIFNAFLFLMSIGGFMWILVHNALGRAAVIKSAKELPIPGCPVVHTGIEWAQWVPGEPPVNRRSGPV